MNKFEEVKNTLLGLIDAVNELETNYHSDVSTLLSTVAANTKSKYDDYELNVPFTENGKHFVMVEVTPPGRKTVRLKRSTDHAVENPTKTPTPEGTDLTVFSTIQAVEEVISFVKGSNINPAGAALSSEHPDGKDIPVNRSSAGSFTTP